jgi:membrane protein DedA with SNARE-associated domain
VLKGNGDATIELAVANLFRWRSGPASATEIKVRRVSQTSQFLMSYGGLILFLIVLAEQSGVPLPAAPFLLTAGALAASGRMNVSVAIVCATAGSLAADSFWFLAGYRSKARLFQLFPRWHGIRAAAARQSNRKLLLRGLEMLTAAKFLPLGLLVPLRAGAFAVNPFRFLLVDAICSLLYTSVYISLGFLFHDQLERIVTIAQRLGVFALVLVVLIVGGYLSLGILKRVRFKKGHAEKIGR